MVEPDLLLDLDQIREAALVVTENCAELVDHRVIESAVRSTLSFVPSGTTIEISAATLLPACVAVMGLCLLAGLYPALRASRVSPMASMRAGT